MAILELDTRSLAILSFLLVAFASASLGKVVTYRADLLSGRIAWRGVLEIVVGYCLLGWMVLVASWLGINSKFECTCLVAVLSIPAAVECLQFVGGSLRNYRFSAMRLTSSYGLLAALAMLTLAPALCPPETWDELVYHAALPQRWRADGNINCYFDLPYSGFPSLCEIVSWSVSGIDVLISPRLVSAVAWLLGVTVLFCIVRIYAQAWIATSIVAAFVLSDAVLLVSGGGYVEPVLMINLAVMLLLFLYTREHPASSSYRLAVTFGILAGGCGAVKLTGVVMLPVALLLLVFCRLPSRDRKWNVLLATLVFAVTAALFMLPFYLRPWFSTGNPFFPYFESWFTTDVNRVESSLFHHAIGSERFGAEGVPGLVLSPVLLGFNQAVFDGSLGLQFCLGLAIVVCGLVKTVRNKPAKLDTVVLAFITVGLFCFWALTAQQARFAIPAALVLYVLAAQQLITFSAQVQNLLAVALVALTLSSAPWGTGWFYAGAWLANLGLVDVMTIVDEGTGFEYLPLASAIDTLTEEDARIMLLLEHRSFYLPRETVIGTPFFQSQSFNPPEDFVTAESVLEVLRDNKVSHLVLATQPVGPDFSLARAERLIPLQRGIEDAAAKGWLELIWQSAMYQVLQVNSPH